MPGEKIIMQGTRKVGRRGRNVVRIRIVGQHSLGWLEAAWLWGCSVEAFVAKEDRVTRLLKQIYPDVYHCLPSQAHHMLPHSPWVGAYLTTIRDDADAALNLRLVERWKPSWIVVAFQSSTTQKQRTKWAPYYDCGYKRYWKEVSHSMFGGVTTSEWMIGYYFREEQDQLSLTVMTMTKYP